MNAHLTNPYTRGQVVTSIQRLLKKHRCLRGKVDGIFGPLTRSSVMTFQAKHGCYVDGIVGPLTWDALHHHSPVLPVNPGLVALYAAQHKNGMIYTQDMQKRMYGVNHKVFLPKLPKYADCSAFATWCYFASKLPDPNGPSFNYNGYGYSQTLWNHGRVVSSKDARSGDLVFYGHAAKPAPVTTHVCVYVGQGRVVSMGQTGGPYIMPMRYRSDLVGVKRYGS